MAAGTALPREIIKWLQGLDLSFSIKNPKRDISNGWIVAEIMSRYYPKDVDIQTYENGTRLAAKVDNWEQLYKLFKKKGVGVSKAEFDPIIHCAPGAASAFLFHLYSLLTKRTVRIAPPHGEEEVPAFMRDTASKRLKDPEIARIEDNIFRTIRAIDTLGHYHEERRAQKAMEAPLLIRQERQLRMGRAGADAQRSGQDTGDTSQVEEVRVKAMTGGTQLKGLRKNEGDVQPTAQTSLLKAMKAAKCSLSALANIQFPAQNVKPAVDIMRPMVYNIVMESKELSKMLDPKKDIVASFMEQCREGVPDAGREQNWDRGAAAPEQRLQEIEECSVKVFETLANRAQLLVDTLIKSPPEFWKVWSTLFPALTDFSESSPIFDSVVFLFKRIGELMRDVDPQLTQGLMTEVGMLSLAKELCRSPEKREALCEIIYSYAQEDPLNHLIVLRALREKIGDKLNVFISCLACFVQMDAQRNLLEDQDNQFLDLYIYYARMAIQSPQPRVRVAGVAILDTIAVNVSEHQILTSLLPQLESLVVDEWWEVQAQLLLLTAHLLRKIAEKEGPEILDGVEEETLSPGGGSSPGGVEAPLGSTNAVVASLKSILSRLFVVRNSKNVLQVGLSAIAPLLNDIPTLIPMFVEVLVEQPGAMRQRLLQQKEVQEGTASPSRRRTYVMGNTSRMYEEVSIPEAWPDVNKELERLGAPSVEQLGEVA